jgi:hypothetical protein
MRDLRQTLRLPLHYAEVENAPGYATQPYAPDRMAGEPSAENGWNDLSHKVLAVAYGRQAATTYRAVGIDGIPPGI